MGDIPSSMLKLLHHYQPSFLLEFAIYDGIKISNLKKFLMGKTV